MLKIKLSPTGKRNAQTYRIVVMEGKSKITGRNLAILGRYSALSQQLKLDKKAALEWISRGAQPTDRIRRLISEAK